MYVGGARVCQRAGGKRTKPAAELRNSESAAGLGSGTAGRCRSGEGSATAPARGVLGRDRCGGTGAMIFNLASDYCVR
ncbi:hypothetical protein GCM10009565_64130 [Amycolatopsis albidoflavus]